MAHTLAYRHVPVCRFLTTMGEQNVLLTLKERSEKKEYAEEPLHLHKKMSINWFLSQKDGVLCHILSTVDSLVMTRG